MNVNIALLTVTDTRTFENDKSGAILVKKIEEANSVVSELKPNFLLIVQQFQKKNLLI